MLFKSINGVLNYIRYSFCKNVTLELFKIPLSSKLELSKKAKVNIKKINIYPNVNIRVRENSLLKIGDNTFFNNGCILTARNRIEIGKKVLLGPNVMIFDHNHDFKSDNMANEFIVGEITIGDNTWIGANVVILKNSHIGKNCVVAAGVVVSNIVIPDNSIYFGNGVIKKINK